MDQVKQAGLKLKRIVLILLILSPLIYIAILYWQGASRLLHLPAGINLEPDAAGIIGMVALYSIPALTPFIYWCALYFIYRIAGQYSAGNVFALQTIQQMRWVGIFLLLADFVYMFQIAITGPLLHFLGLTEQFLLIELKLGVSIIGLFILLISRIMLIALKQHEEQRLTI